MDAVIQLKRRLADVTSLNEVLALASWDMQTQMPPEASDSRARHTSLLSKLSHTMFTADETGELLAAAEQALNDADVNADSDDVRLVKVARRDYDKARKLPTELVIALTEAATRGYDVWVKARETNDFPMFIPALTRIIELKQQVAEYKGYAQHPYDAMLDDYAEGTTTADVDAMFDGLRTDIVPLVAAIRERVGAVDDRILHQPFDVHKQREFAEKVAQKFGFDFKRGRQDQAVHPFCTSFSRNDVRITTRFDPNWLNPALFGTLHETGHGLYEQGVSPALEGNLLCGGTSLAVHESQSRLWENVVGRGHAMWSYYYPQLQATFPEQLGNVPLDVFYRAINRVEPSFIRVEADEATYNLHIMIRFEIEKELIIGKLAVKDLPQVWNGLYEQYLGIVPPTDTLGVLQDIHWADGLFGYFPTYSMGNLLSVQLYEQALANVPSIPDEIRRGEFGSLLNWMHDHIYVYGRKYDTAETIQRATGQTLDAGPYVTYLKRKYADIYGL